MAYSVFNSIKIAGLATTLPLNNASFNEDNIAKRNLYRASDLQTTSDFGYTASKRILDEKQIPLEEVGVLIFASKTPDYRGPATAAVLQGRLDLSQDCIAYDVNVGSIGFVLGTQIVASHLESINKKYGLLITGDTPTKQVSEHDNSLNFFNDGAAAILFEESNDQQPVSICTKSFTDHYDDYMINKGGFRNYNDNNSEVTTNDRSIDNNYLKIDQEKFLRFAEKEIPDSLVEFLEYFNIKETDFDALALHQFNKNSLEDLTSKFEKSYDQLLVNFNKYGNTCGSSIPLLLSDTYGDVKDEVIRVLSCTYGEGFSLGIMDVSIATNDIFEITKTDYYFNEGFITHK